MEYPSSSSSSAFDHAAHTLAVQHQVQEHQKHEKRYSWSWFRKGSSSGGDRNNTDSSSSCFTGGLSVDYRDCEAPPQTNKVEGLSPRSSFTSTLSCSSSSYLEKDNKKEELAAGIDGQQRRNTERTSFSSSTILMDIELEWESSSTSQDGDTAESCQQEQQEARLEEMDQDIVREHVERFGGSLLLQAHNKNNGIPCSSSLRTGRNSGVVVAPPQAIFQNLIGSMGASTSSNATEMSETQPVISFHPQTIEEENVDASSSSAGAAASRDRWDPELAAELLYFQQSAPSPADYSNTARTRLLYWLHGLVTSPKQISGSLAVLFMILLIYFIGIDLVASISGGSAQQQRTSSAFASSSSDEGNDPAIHVVSSISSLVVSAVESLVWIVDLVWNETIKLI